MIANGNLVLESTGPTLAITGNGGIYVDRNTISGSPYINKVSLPAPPTKISSVVPPVSVSLPPKPCNVVCIDRV
jgi:hypothetical protein